MKIKYFKDTDTLYIEFRATGIVETRDLDENTLVDLDKQGNICAIAVEHAGERAGMPNFSFEEIVAPDQSSFEARFDQLREWGERTGIFRGIDADEYVRQLRQGWGSQDEESGPE